MSKSLIITGTNPNDGNGDTLLVGAGRINSNFNEIYNTLGNGSNLNIGVGATVISTNAFGNVGIGTTNSTSKFSVSGNTSLETLNVSGVSTFNGNLSFNSNIGIGTTNPSSTLYLVGNQYVSGILTAATFSGNLIGSANVTTLAGFAATITSLTGTAATITTLNSTNATITTLNSTNGTITNITGTAGTINNATIPNLVGTAGTIANLTSTDANITSLTGTNLNYSGISSVGSLSIGSTEVISSARQLKNITSLDSTTTATIESAIQLAPNNFNDLNVTGVSTFTNGPVLIGSGTSTGTALQRLQVTGGGYVSSNLGIGHTNPTSRLDVVGDGNFTGVVTAGRFGSPVLVGSATSTGTASQNLQVIGGGYVSQSLGIGETNPIGLLHLSAAGPFIVGSGTSTGTAAQRLQVSGGGYIAGNLGVGAASTNPTSLIHLAPGTTSVAQLEFTSGSLLTFASAGVVEYDGTTLFATPNTSYGRASIPTMIYTSGAGTILTLGSEGTTQPLFPSANDTISLPIGTYRIEFGISMTRAATSTTIATLNVTLNGSGGGSAGTFSGIADGTVATTSASAIAISGSSITSSVPISVTTTTASATYTITFTGILRITTAGTFQPRYSLSSNLVSASGANSISAANYMILQSIATSGSAAATGAWA